MFAVRNRTACRQPVRSAPAPERETQRRRRAGRGTGRDAERSSERSCPLPHALESVAVRRFGRIEAGAVVRHRQGQPAPFDIEVNVDERASRVPDRIVQALLENEVRLATLVGVHRHVAIRSGSTESEAHVPRVEKVGGEPAHPLDDVAELVAHGVDRPDDVAHRIDELAGRRGDLVEMVRELQRSALRARAGDLAQDRDLCEA